MQKNRSRRRALYRSQGAAASRESIEASEAALKQLLAAGGSRGLPNAINIDMGWIEPQGFAHISRAGPGAQ